jgi:hypothetical protein
MVLYNRIFTFLDSRQEDILATGHQVHLNAVVCFLSVSPSVRRCQSKCMNVNMWDHCNLVGTFVDVAKYCSYCIIITNSHTFSFPILV